MSKLPCPRARRNSTRPAWRIGYDAFVAAPDNCPVCGADLSGNAKVCPECGSCEETGWSEKARYDSLGIPDEDFNYEEFVKEEFGPTRKPRGMKSLWVLIALGLAALFLVFWR